MAGNVWEWCATPYMGYNEYPAAEELLLDTDETQKAGERHVVRGGSWFLEHSFLRCSSRYAYLRVLDNADVNFGVRLARLFS
jgi:formylglycine-generating enzyme required for sulfatase activity